ncbi:hypothetical protein [uncultured Treponema sp.]|uniref:hypothetical protein n=1 Tax=uncultured Treponema sp. TaxID=162155 RepID=UPI002595CBD2|nr:hypothetical protein [uncultured Treponema sp.]MDY4526094.1 hypothetical protein [Treponema sp.]
MSRIEFFKKESKNLLKDWKTQTTTTGSNGIISYHYESKFYNVDDVFTSLNWDDKDRQQIMLARAQHAIAQLAKFKNWPSLLSADEVELEKAEKLIRALKEKTEIAKLITESDKKPFNPCFRIRCMCEMTLSEKNSFKVELVKIINKIKDSVKDTEYWIDFFDFWDTIDDSGREKTFYERREYLKRKLKNRKESYSKIIIKAYKYFSDRPYFGCYSPVVMTQILGQLGIRVYTVNLKNNKIAGFCSKFFNSDFDVEVQEPVIVINKTLCNTPERYLKEMAKQLYYMIAKNDEFDFADNIIKYEMTSTQNEAEQFYEDLAISPDYLNRILKEESYYGPKDLTRDYKDFFLKNYEIEPIIQRIKSSFFIDYKTAIKKLMESNWEYNFMFDNFEEVEQFYLDCVKKYEEHGMKKIKYLNGEPEPLDWSETNLEHSKQYID